MLVVDTYFYCRFFQQELFNNSQRSNMWYNPQQRQRPKDPRSNHQWQVPSYKDREHRSGIGSMIRILK